MAGAALADIAGPVRVIDADTIDVGGERVRLFGIDAPEMDQTCRDGTGEHACGVWARDRVDARFGFRVARCEVLDTDRYGRSVARCLVGDEDMAQVIVQEGWAFAYRRYSMDYDLDEKGAAVRGAGLHAMRVQSPAQFRRARGQAPEPSAQKDCVIKGNISGNGQIYHVPGQEFYSRTRISAARGERWFCTEAAARAAGWRRAQR